MAHTHKYTKINACELKKHWPIAKIPQPTCRQRILYKSTNVAESHKSHLHSGSSPPLPLVFETIWGRCGRVSVCMGGMIHGPVYTGVLLTTHPHSPHCEQLLWGHGRGSPCRMSPLRNVSVPCSGYVRKYYVKNRAFFRNFMRDFVNY